MVPRSTPIPRNAKAAAILFGAYGLLVHAGVLAAAVALLSLGVAWGLLITREVRQAFR